MKQREFIAIKELVRGYGCQRGRASRTLAYWMNRGMISLILILAFYTGRSMILVEKGNVLANVRPGAVGHIEKTELLPDRKTRPLEYYTQKLRQRNLFEPPDLEETLDETVLKKALPALHHRIKLIGILVAENSQAIIENLEDQQTHILSKGEWLGTIHLEEVLDDKVIFTDGDRRVEMAL